MSREMPSTRTVQAAQPLTVDQRAFLADQYKALRAEILALKGRVVKVLGLSVTGIPVVLGAGAKFDLDFVLIASPAFTMIWALMLIFEQAGIMRAGLYIRLYLEPNLMGSPLPMSWETFLESYPENRRVEWYFAYAAHGTFVLYYVLGTVMAREAMMRRYGAASATILTSLYAGMFAVSFFFVLKSLILRHDRRGEQPRYPGP